MTRLKVNSVADTFVANAPPCTVFGRLKKCDIRQLIMKQTGFKMKH